MTTKKLKKTGIQEDGCHEEDEAEDGDTDDEQTATQTN